MKMDADRVLVHYEWAEPGDPPNPDYASVRSAPLAKPVVYPSLTPEVELDLVRRYHHDGDLDALEQLVGAHRPMVVSMARRMSRGNGTSLRALVEYGILGLRLAAAPRRPSLTKKGKMVGFDVDAGHRFSTYARSHALKEMRAAVSEDPSPALNPEFQQKVIVETETWGERSKSEEEADRPSDLNIAPRPDHDYWRSPKYGWDLTLSAPGHRCANESSGGSALAFVSEWLGYAGEGISYLQRRRWHYCSKVQSTLWNPPSWAKDQFKRKVRLRNYKKHPITRTELADRTAFCGVWRVKLEAYEKIALEGMEGWGDDDPDSIESNQAEFMVASFFRSHALRSEQYKLPNNILRRRWRIGCKRQGQIIPLETNQGLGLFDKHGQRLPDFTYIGGKVISVSRLQSTPNICLYGIASIYLVGGEVNGVEGEIISRKRLWKKSWAALQPRRLDNQTPDREETTHITARRAVANRSYG